VFRLDFVYAAPMSAEESELEMVRRHVREGTGHVANQRALIIRLWEHCLPTAEAEALLANFEDLQGQHEAHLARAEAEASPGEVVVGAPEA
jgi:hypothetical protein